MIAAPHALCVRGRGCDRLAGEAALTIAGDLTRLGARWRLLLPRQTRAQCDVNRTPARQTVYRSALRSESQTARLVLDVHSFMPNKGRIGTLAGERQFLLLDLCSGGQLSATTASASAALRSRGWPVAVVCSQLGDIRAEMAGRGVPVLSLEVSYNLAAHMRRRLYRDLALWAATFAT